MKLTSEVDEKKLEEARKKQRLDRKLTDMFREIAWQLIFLCLILWVIVGPRDANVFYQNEDVKNVFYRSVDGNVRDVTPETFHSILS